MKSSLPLYNAAQTRALDAAAIAAGVPGYTLMQRAAQAAYAHLRARWPDARRLLVLAGPGNNGGDALEFARIAHQDGLEVQAVLLADPARLRGEALEALQACRRDGVPWMAASAEVQAAQCVSDGLLRADVAVDGLLGTGVSRPVSALFAAAMSLVQDSALPVLALDLPSGIHADTGSVLGQALPAQLTVSFIARKQGLYTGVALDYVGECRFESLEVDPGVDPALEPSIWLLPDRLGTDVLPPRPRNAYKGRCGHVWAIGGGLGMSGAIRLCSMAALRAGAGLVSVLAHADNLVALRAGQPEVMVHGWTDEDDFAAATHRATVLAVGPGLGRDRWARGLLQGALDRGLPLVLDADALHLLELEQPLPPDCIITPHPGEAARLLGCEVADLEADRYGSARELARRYAAICVLKGAGSVIAMPDGRCFVCAAGNPGMASGGMGDVLTGLVAALRAQGLSAEDAACAGVLLHAQAGDVAARDGQRGMLASDLLAPLRRLVNPVKTA